MITAPDDNVVRSHDDAAALLRYAATGAHVEIYVMRARDAAHEASRGYVIALPRLGRPDAVVRASYTLPAPASRLLEQTRRALDAALKA